MPGGKNRRTWQGSGPTWARNPSSLPTEVYRTCTYWGRWYEELVRLGL